MGEEDRGDLGCAGSLREACGGGERELLREEGFGGAWVVVVVEDGGLLRGEGIGGAWMVVVVEEGGLDC